MQAITIRFSDEEYEALAGIAGRIERSKNEIVREGLRNLPDIQVYLQSKNAQDAAQKLTWRDSICSI